MKKSQSSELWKLSDEELKKELTTVREGLFKLRFQKVVEEVVDTSNIRKTRKKIARILTILRKREMETSAKTDTAEN